MGVKAEIEAIQAEIKKLFPKREFKLQQDVKEPTVLTCAIKRLGAETGTTTTSHRYANNATFRVVLYGPLGISVLDDAEVICDAFADLMFIKPKGDDVAHKLGPLSVSDSFETERAGVHAVIIMFSTTRQARRNTAPAKPKIQRIYTRKGEI